MGKLTGKITWHEINGKSGAGEWPDADLEILIYDGNLDDTVKGYFGQTSDGQAAWIDETTGDPLPDPQWWADVPFPGEKQ